jgi:alkanesulfonate monooxygenase SsuD/methylene tetrahydromethanopterin reductase-like flavin-dependent oxidoreductase (luciferase family)
VQFGIAGWFREATLGDPDEFLDMFALADRLGFDAAWLNEFHFERENHPFPNTLLLAAAGFARTQRLRIGLSVVVLPIYHPLLLAEALAQLDYQSQGRLDVGIGRGTTPTSLTALEIDSAETRGRFAEAYDILLEAWTNDRASYAGRHWQFADVAVGPPPVQRPHPPIYVAGMTHDTVQFAVDRDLPLILASETERETIAEYRELIEARGQPLNPNSVEARGQTVDLSSAVFSRYVCIAPTRADAERLADQTVERLNAQKRKTNPSAPPAYDPETFRRRDAILGTPDECIAQIHALHATCRADRLRLFFNKAGTVDRETERGMMHLFAREVIPACRQLESAPVHV